MILQVDLSSTVLANVNGKLILLLKEIFYLPLLLVLR
jgi:hypothetical protein